MSAGANPTDRRYTTEHEWIKAEGEHYVVGITAFAQDQLGDIVYIELPKVGDHVEAASSSGSSSPSKPPPICMRRSAATSSRSIPPWSSSRRASTTIPTKPAG